MYKLKNGQESFELVDGPHAGKTFVRGRTYTEVPEDCKHLFKSVKAEGGRRKAEGAVPPTLFSQLSTLNSQLPTESES